MDHFCTKNVEIPFRFRMYSRFSHHHENYLILPATKVTMDLLTKIPRFSNTIIRGVPTYKNT